MKRKAPVRLVLAKSESSAMSEYSGNVKPSVAVSCLPLVVITYVNIAVFHALTMESSRARSDKKGNKKVVHRCRCV